MRSSKDKRVVSLCLPGPNPANVRDIDFSHAASTFQPASQKEIPLECLRINARIGRGKRFLGKRRVVTMPVDLSNRCEKIDKPLPKEPDGVVKPETRTVFDKPLPPVKKNCDDMSSRNLVEFPVAYRKNGYDVSPMSSFDRKSMIFDEDSLLMKRDSISLILSLMISSVTSHSISGESSSSFEAYLPKNKSFDALTLPTLSDHEINVHETCIYDDMLACPRYLSKEDSLFESDINSDTSSCLHNEAGHFKNLKALNVHDRRNPTYSSKNHDSLAIPKVRGSSPAKSKNNNAQKPSDYRSKNASSIFSAAKSLGDSKRELKSAVLLQPFKYPLDIGHDFVYSKYHFASTRNISLPDNQADKQTTNKSNIYNKSQASSNKILSSTASRLKSAGELKIRIISSILP